MKHFCDCGSLDTKTLESRWRKVRSIRGKRRRLECLECKGRCTTIEIRVELLEELERQAQAGRRILDAADQLEMLAKRLRVKTEISDE